MQLNITARHNSKISEAVRNRIVSKLKKNASHFDHISNIQVTIDQDGKQHVAEATLHITTGGEIFAKAVADNLFQSIDSLSDKIDKQLLKIKTKMAKSKLVDTKRA